MRLTTYRMKIVPWIGPKIRTPRSPVCRIHLKNMPISSPIQDTASANAVILKARAGLLVVTLAAAAFSSRVVTMAHMLRDVVDRAGHRISAPREPSLRRGLHLP